MGNMRNTVAYFKKQVAPTTSIEPTHDTDGYVSIEKPDVTTGQKELLSSDLLSGNISMKKPQLGIESTQASVVTEIRSHGDAANPTEPDFGSLFESGVGAPFTGTIEAVAALPAPSTTEFGFASEGNIRRYDMLIIANATDGRVARFVKSLKIDIIAGLNDKIDFDEGAGALAATLTPGSYGHGGSTTLGSIGEHIKSVLDAAGADVYTVIADEQKDGSYLYSLSSDGATFELDNTSGPNAALSVLKLNLGFADADLAGALSYLSPASAWGNRAVLSTPMDTAPTAADVVHPSINYKPINEGHAHLTAGFYQGNSDTDGYFEQIVGALVSSIGINIETGAIAKFNFELVGLLAKRSALTESPFDPDYEDVQGLVGFNVQAFVNDVCVDANAIALTIENDVSEKKSFKQANGKIGSIVRSRSITGNINPYADGSVDYYTALQNLTDYDFMLIIGKRDAGGFIVGQTVGIYLPQIMITQDKTSEIDDNIIEDINFSGHSGEDGTKVDLAVSFG